MLHGYKAERNCWGKHGKKQNKSMRCNWLHWNTEDIKDKARFKTGDVRPWKQEERAWTWNTNGGKGFNRDWNGQAKRWKKFLITEVITTAMILKINRSVVSTYILKEGFRAWFVEYWKAGRSASFSMYHSNPLSADTRLNPSCCTTSFPSPSHKHRQTPFVTTNTRLNVGLEQLPSSLLL